MALSAPFSGYMVFSSTLEANFKEKPSLLCNLFFGSVYNWHLYLESLKGRWISSFLFKPIQELQESCIMERKHQDLDFGLGHSSWSSICSHYAVTAVA
jgi:hypothetical protein